MEFGIPWEYKSSYIMATSAYPHPGRPGDKEISINARTTEDASLGRDIRLRANTHVKLNTGLYELKFFTGSVELELQIGPHTDLIMSRDAWEDLLQGARVSMQTLRQYLEANLNNNI